MIVFSHGFGVDKNSRGLFSDIAGLFSEQDVMLFDYNEIDDLENTITVATLDAQAKKLTKVLAGTDEPINLVCHSQGCLVAALANPIGLQSILFLAPVSTTTSSEFKELLGDRLEVISGNTPDRVQRKDGTVTIIDQSYWDSLDAADDVEKLYEKLASANFLTIVTAGADEIVNSSFPSLTNKAEIHTLLGADHNFTGESRTQLLDIFRQLNASTSSN
jgi:predicted alpha/beta hydrolase family esterase